MPEYLMKNFPERARPAGGDHGRAGEGVISMWDVPTQGSRPHDPLAARDGSIWWTGQLVNKLGRIDPKTGTIREYTLKTPHTGPHGLAEDKDGNIWFTGNNAGTDRQARPEDRHHHRISAARPEREGPAHDQHRARRNRLVHRAAAQHGGAARPEERRDQAASPRRTESRVRTD